MIADGLVELGRVQAGEGLVEEQQLGLGREGPGDLEPLALAERKPLGDHVPVVVRGR